MKIVVVWFCLLTRVSAFPTEPPKAAEEQKPCCVESPRFLFKGYDSKNGINVFLFEFLPLKNGSKSKVIDETIKPSVATSEGKDVPLSNTEDENQDEIAVKETNTPAYPQHDDIPKTVSHLTNVSSNTAGTKKDSKFPGTSINLSPDNIHQQDRGRGTHISPTTAAKDDTGKYGKVEKTDMAVGDEAKNTEVGITNDHNDVDGFYSTEGITLTDVSGYTDTKDIKQDPKVSVPSQDEKNSDIIDCSKADSRCKSTSEYIEHRQDTRSTTHREEHYPSGNSFDFSTNVTQGSKSHTNKPSGRHKKLVTHRDSSRQQPVQPKINNKQFLTTYNNNRHSNYSRKQRQRYAHSNCSHNLYHYRPHHKHSSSESGSDSSQQIS